MNETITIDATKGPFGLAIDQGISNGVALVNPRGDLLWSSTMTIEELIELEFSVTPIFTVIERSVPHGVGRLARELNRGMGLLQGRYPQAQWITSGMWKTSRFMNIDIPTSSHKLSRHEKDAYRIGMYWFDRKGISL